jgi:hypothetical protein
MDNWIQCGTIQELVEVVAALVREGIMYTADTATMKVRTTGGY